MVLIKEDGERSFLTNANGSLRRLKIEDVRMPFPEGARFLALPASLCFLKIDCRSLKKIFAQAKSQGMTVCADMTKRKHGETVEDIKEALEYVDYILPNEEEACLVTGKDTAEEAAERLLEAGVKNVVIKCGARGCLVKEQKGMLQGDGEAGGKMHRYHRSRRQSLPLGLSTHYRKAGNCGTVPNTQMHAEPWRSRYWERPGGIQAGASDKPCENGG